MNAVHKVEVILKNQGFHLVVEELFVACNSERAEVFFCGIQPRHQRQVIPGPRVSWNPSCTATGFARCHPELFTVMPFEFQNAVVSVLEIIWLILK